MKDVRLLPLVIVAIFALLALKGIGLVFGEAPIFGGTGPAMAQESEEPKAAETAEPGTDSAGAEDVAGDPAEGKTPAEGEMASQGEDDPSFLDRVMGGKSRSREALLESLSERREALDARGEELDLRENLLKAAEQRVEQRIAELKELEARITAADDQRKLEEDERMKGLVTMYENMKPKDAARIFNRLDMPVVVKVASLMSARQMSLVLAAMDSAVAQQLTLELSADPTDPLASPDAGGDLPQIVGTQPAN